MLDNQNESKKNYPHVSLDPVFVVRPVGEALEVIPDPLVLCVEDVSAIFTLLKKKQP